MTDRSEPRELNRVFFAPRVADATLFIRQMFSSILMHGLTFAQYKFWRAQRS
jgi:hypothetical protein